MRRLVLGCGGVGHALIERLGESPDDLVVIDSDGDRVEALRTETVAAEHADPTDPGAIAAVEGRIDSVLVAGDDPEDNRAAATAAREAYPDAALVVYDGLGASDSVRAEMAEVADRVVEGGAAVATDLLGRLEGGGERVRDLRGVLRGIEGTLGIVMHDNPDPDAIASAIALRAIATHFGIDAQACYFGDISHQENRALVNLLDLDLRNLDPEGFDPGEFDAVALVDHARPGVNDQLPPDTPVDVVIDHHPPRAPIEASVADLRSDVGATSTLLADYFRRLGLGIDERVATALLYGIRVDTRDFSREIAGEDFEAAAYLLPHADITVLERIENPSITADTFDTMARAIKRRRSEDGILVSCVGSINDRDALAQAADQLLALDGTRATLVCGYAEGIVYISARARGTDFDIGETLRQAFGQIGSAGGHVDMAGAQIPLGILGEVEEGDDSLDSIVEDVITERFFETARSLQPAPAVDPAPEDPDDTGASGESPDGAW